MMGVTSSKLVFVKRMIKLRVTLRIWPLIINVDVDFLAVNTLNNAYNAILGENITEQGKSNCFNPSSLNEVPNTLWGWSSVSQSGDSYEMLYDQSIRDNNE